MNTKLVVFFVSLFLTLVILGTIFVPISAERINISAERSKIEQEMSQVCGQGIVIRTDGSVIIDSWKQYSPQTGIPTIPNINNMLSRPVGVTFGSTLDDKLKTCFESPEGDGVICFPLGDVRKKMGVK